MKENKFEEKVKIIYLKNAVDKATRLIHFGIKELEGINNPEYIVNIIRNLVNQNPENISASRYLAWNIFVNDDIAHLKHFLDQVEKEGVELAWEQEHCPAVFTGPDTAGAHAGPTNRDVKHGHVLNIDFGVKIDDYCSDLQRSWYILKPGETEAPDNVKHGFKTIEDSITKSTAALKPGVTGNKIDTIARNHIVDQGYEEYPHALGAVLFSCAAAQETYRAHSTAPLL